MYIAWSLCNLYLFERTSLHVASTKLEAGVVREKEMMQ